ncbi:ABC transporter permease [Sorangium sp. So ce136]|uniref:ABC transporter permease n=1 Tax=Sorangium sp. So ce136 TaxID=3133284 RepID=UPI003F0AC0D1
MSHLADFLRRHLLGAAPFLVLLLAWFVVSRTGAISSIFLPSLLKTLQSFLGLLSVAFLTEHLFPSALRVGVAFLLSVGLAFPLGILGGQVPVVARLIHPICGFMRYLPVAAFVPLCILWFGIDDGQKVAVIVIGVVLQLVLLFAASSASVPKELIEAGLTFGLRPSGVLVRIVIPAALPSIWDDLRVSAGWAWSYVVLAELVAGSSGIGYYIIQSQRYLETDRVFAGILFVGVIGACTDWLFRLAASRLFKWA